MTLTELYAAKIEEFCRLYGHALSAAIADRLITSGEIPFTDDEIRDSMASVEEELARDIGEAIARALVKALLRALAKKHGLDAVDAEARGSVEMNELLQGLGLEAEDLAVKNASE